MNRYDDDHVIALLRDAVPAVPDARPDRIVAIRAAAGRQRTMVWTQTLGAVASVLLVVGVSAALTTPAGDRVEPTNQPISVLADALLSQRSVRFEASMEPTGDPRVPGLPATQVRRMLTSSVEGAATRDGDLRVDGDLSFMNAMFLGTPESPAEHETRIRVVDGKLYRTIEPGEEVPPGKKWILDGDAGSEPMGVEQLARLLRMASGFVDDVRYTGQGTVRGTRVAEYELTIPASTTQTDDIELDFALDADNLLRRVSAELSWSKVLGYDENAEASYGWSEADADGTGQTHESPPPPSGGMSERPTRDPLDVRVEIEFFGYGDDVRIVAPPAAEVATWDELYGGGETDSSYDELERCREEAESHDDQQACYDAFEKDAAGATVPLAPDGEGCTYAYGQRRCAASVSPLAPSMSASPAP